ncbi:hypothetical protein LIER_03050 [Lithospermum erythrorhizon]|uniref:Protein KAKU4 n=1 Tax=Lithospermum erythrorhizon TaxID=34254 RepID=A0AAV3NRV0_LITER
MDPQPPPHPRSVAVYDGAGGGGKITTNKRRWRFNPYNRPPPPEPAAPPPLRSPSWISGIASGAAKIISAVFVSDSSSSSSSESDEEELEEEINLDDDVNYDNGRDSHLNGTNRSNLAERKHIIKELLLQETFSREECDMLVKIIHSRVLEHSSVDRVETVDSALIPGRSILNVTPDHAVMEAKKFLEEKNAGRSLQSEFGHGSSGLYSSMIQHIGSEAGSPADMAKSYMQSLPPWASPSTGHFELRTHSTMLTRLTSEEKLHSASKEGKYVASGAWNMQEEIRRVRSKATEDILRPLSSSKDTNFSCGNGSKSAELTEPALQQHSETQKANSVSPLPASLSEGDTMGENQRHTVEGNTTSHEKMTNDFPLEYKCELLSELHVDVPTGYDSANVESGSQKSYEGLSQEQSEPEGKKVGAGKSDGLNMNQQGKTPVRRQPRRQKKA